MMNSATADFCWTHRHDDTAQLALQGASDPLVDLPQALQQIDGYQLAERKVPHWADNRDIIYPPRRAMEQCSSAATAQYKVSLLARLLPALPTDEPLTLVDLTGGTGIDTHAIASLVDKAYYYDADPTLCAIAQHNFAALSQDNITVSCQRAEDVVSTLHSAHQHVTIAYIDPDRRQKDQRKYALADCQPNVIALADELLDIAHVVVVKCSPMLSWHKVVCDLPHVQEVHLVAVNNECKELLVVMSSTRLHDEVVITCANDHATFSFTPSELLQATADIAEPLSTDTQGYLLQPNAAIMAAGAYTLLSQRYQLPLIDHNSHLFLSPQPIPALDDLCNTYVIHGITSLNKHSLKDALRNITHANIITRNFPLTPAQLQQRLHLRDGGNIHLFATTDSHHHHRLIITSRLA